MRAAVRNTDRTNLFAFLNASVHSHVPNGALTKLALRFKMSKSTLTFLMNSVRKHGGHGEN